jgi:hypothetical protein
MREKFGGIIVAIALLATAGCAQQLAEAPAVDPLVLCTSYKAVLGTVNDVLASGTLSDEQVVSIGERVQDANLVVIGTEASGYTNGLCTGPTVPETNSAAAQRVLAGLSNLVAIQQEIE